MIPEFGLLTFLKKLFAIDLEFINSIILIIDTLNVSIANKVQQQCIYGTLKSTASLLQTSGFLGFCTVEKFSEVEDLL